jgi:hypothetical protein
MCVHYLFYHHSGMEIMIMFMMIITPVYLFREFVLHFFRCSNSHLYFTCPKQKLGDCENLYFATLVTHIFKNFDAIKNTGKSSGKMIF